MNADANKLDLFDAVCIAELPDGGSQIPAYYSQTGVTHINVGDIGVVIGDWLGNKYRVEAVNEADAIVWQDHFDRSQLTVVPTTDAAFSRRRINQHWAWQLSLSHQLLKGKARENALAFARKVMAFARRNVELLADRLSATGYEFAGGKPLTPPEEDVADKLTELSNRGVHVPISLQAWLIEVGGVDFRGTHPEWPRTGYYGMGDDATTEDEPWFTDPLCIEVTVQSLLGSLSDDGAQAEDHFANCIEIPPDIITKANISGAGPISLSSAEPCFDNVLVGQLGSLTLLSYLRHAFAWGGFPGFDFIPDAPTNMLEELTQGLTRL